MTETTLTVRVESDERFHERVESDLEALEAGVDLDDTHELSLPSDDALARVLSATNLELIRAIATEEPESMRATARLVDRDVKDVHSDLTELTEYGLVELRDEGQAKRPVVWYDEIELRVSISSTGQDQEEPVGV